jgi:hypothetical protein
MGTCGAGTTGMSSFAGIAIDGPLAACLVKSTFEELQNMVKPLRFLNPIAEGAKLPSKGHSQAIPEYQIPIQVKQKCKARKVHPTIPNRRTFLE